LSFCLCPGHSFLGRNSAPVQWSPGLDPVAHT